MPTNVVRVRSVRKPTLVLIKGGRGQSSPTLLTGEERYPRVPPAWVDWLVVELLLAALNFPFPIFILMIAATVIISFILARHMKREGGQDPNIHYGIAAFFAGFFLAETLKRPLERKFPSITALDKQLVTFAVCEMFLYSFRHFLLANLSQQTQQILTLLVFLGVFYISLTILRRWDA